jgi:hypothetical protein
MHQCSIVLQLTKRERYLNSILFIYLVYVIATQKAGERTTKSTAASFARRSIAKSVGTLNKYTVKRTK